MSIAEAVNYATPRWLEYGKRSIKCCDVQPPAFKMDEFIRKFDTKEAYKKWMNGCDVLPHPELPMELKYQYMLQNFNDLSKKSNSQTTTIQRQKELIADQEYKINMIETRPVSKSPGRTKPIKLKIVAADEPGTSVPKSKKSRVV